MWKKVCIDETSTNIKYFRSIECVDQSSGTDYRMIDNGSSEHFVMDINVLGLITKMNQVKVELVEGRKMLSGHNGSVSTDNEMKIVKMRTAC